MNTLEIFFVVVVVILIGGLGIMKYWEKDYWTQDDNSNNTSKDE